LRGAHGIRKHTPRPPPGRRRERRPMVEAWLASQVTRRGAFRGIVAIVAVWATAPTLHAGQEDKGKASQASLSAEMAELVAAHNRERAAANLAPLAANEKLVAAALVHARDMAGHDTMSHDGSDGSKFNERIERQGYYGRRLAENIAKSQRTVAQVMREWMNS